MDKAKYRRQLLEIINDTKSTKQLRSDAMKYHRDLSTDRVDERDIKRFIYYRRVIR